MRKTLVAASLLLASAASTTPLMGQADDEITRKTLVGLKGISVVVENITGEAPQHGLAQNQVQTDVELKLRQAGIRVLSSVVNLSELDDAFLYVNVNPFKTKTGLYAFNLELQLRQWVRLIRDSSVSVVATTWEATSVLGTVGEAKLSQVRDDVRDMTDQFINAYLAANPKR